MMIKSKNSKIVIININETRMKKENSMVKYMGLVRLVDTDGANGVVNGMKNYLEVG